jgi:hypothetical protein
MSTTGKIDAQASTSKLLALAYIYVINAAKTYVYGLAYTLCDNGTTNSRYIPQSYASECSYDHYFWLLHSSSHLSPPPDNCRVTIITETVTNASQFGECTYGDAQRPTTHTDNTSASHPESKDIEWDDGYRYDDPVIGRWPSRDPLGDEVFFSNVTTNANPARKLSLRKETYGNLYAFVKNGPTSKTDWLGLAIALPVYKRVMGAGLFDGVPYHAYLEFYGNSAGFAANGSIFGGDGIVSVPDSWGGNEEDGWAEGSYRIAQLYVQNCCIDVAEFEKNLKDALAALNGSTAMNYCVGLYDCRHLATTAVEDSMKRSVRDDASWWCAIRAHWWWGAVKGDINLIKAGS